MTVFGFAAMSRVWHVHSLLHVMRRERRPRRLVADAPEAEYRLPALLGLRSVGAGATFALACMGPVRAT